MKQTPMPQRSAPMDRGQGLERGAGPVRRVPLRAVSAALAAENRVRRAMVAQLWPERPLCVVYELSQVSPGLVPDEVTGRCGRWADDVHEPLTRARGGSITDPGNAVPPCRPCHEALGLEPTWGYALGLIRHSWGVA